MSLLQDLTILKLLVNICPMQVLEGSSPLKIMTYLHLMINKIPSSRKSQVVLAGAGGDGLDFGEGLIQNSD